MHALKSRKKQIEEWRREKTRYPEEAEPPVAEVMVGLGCDGDPAEQALRLQFVKAALPSKDRQYPDDILVSFGGFHTELKTLNSNGELFEELLRRCSQHGGALQTKSSISSFQKILHRGRKSTDGINWQCIMWPKKRCGNGNATCLGSAGQQVHA